MTGENSNKIVKYLRSIKTRRTSLRLQNKIKARTERAPFPFHSLGLFSSIPEELLFYIFNSIPLYDLASLTLTSRGFRNKILTFHYSSQALSILKPAIRATTLEEEQEKRKKLDEVTYHSHFHNTNIIHSSKICSINYF